MPGGATSTREANEEIALYAGNATQRWFGVSLLDPKESREILEQIAGNAAEDLGVRRTAISKLDATQSVTLLRRLEGLDSAPEVRQAAKSKLRR